MNVDKETRVKETGESMSETGTDETACYRRRQDHDYPRSVSRRTGRVLKLWSNQRRGDKQSRST